MITLFVNVIVACVMVEMGEACWGGGGGGSKGPPSDKVKEPRDKSKHKTENEINKILESAWGGFTVPRNELESWQAWLLNYMKESKNQQLNDKGIYDDAEGLGFWEGAGLVHEGFPPMEIPPWGYKAKNTGLPELCYSPTDAGKCADQTKEKPSKRWSYNPYTEECVEFDFIGCEGNKNNFGTRLKCEEACTNPDPNVGCDLHSGIPLEKGQDEEVPEEFKHPRSRRRCSLKQPTI